MTLSDPKPLHIHPYEQPSPPSPCPRWLPSHLGSISSSPLSLPIPRCPQRRGLNRSRGEAALTSPKLPRPPSRGRRGERNESGASPVPLGGSRVLPINGSGAGGSAAPPAPGSASQLAQSAPELNAHPSVTQFPHWDDTGREGARMENMMGRVRPSRVCCQARPCIRGEEGKTQMGPHVQPLLPTEPLPVLSQCSQYGSSQAGMLERPADASAHPGGQGHQRMMVLGTECQQELAAAAAQTLANQEAAAAPGIAVAAGEDSGQRGRLTICCRHRLGN